MKYISTLYFFFVISLSLDAQIIYGERLELELKDGYEDEKLLEFGGDGFVFFSKREIALEGKREWKFEWFDSTLNLENTERIFLDRKQRLVKVYQDGEEAILLFRNRGRKTHIVSLSGKNELKVYDINISKKMRVSDIVTSQGQVLLAGKLRRKPYLTIIDLQLNERTLLPLSIYGIEDNDVTIGKFQKLDEEETLVYLKVRNTRRKYDLYVMRLKKGGAEKELWELNKDIEENLVDISATRIGQNHYAFIGTYSDRMRNQAEGLFFFELKDGQCGPMSRRSFLSLDNFFIYLSPRRQNRIERKKDRRAQKGKEFNVSHHIAYHDLITLEDGYISIGEAYHPTYTSEIDVNGLCVEEFDGYQYTHAVIAKYDVFGNLVWDHIFELNPSYKPFSEKRFIALDKDRMEGLSMLFMNENRIVSKTISYDGVILQERSSEEISTLHEGDRSKRAFAQINHWYDDYFIAYGAQKIKNRETDANVARKRKVYFLSKLRYGGGKQTMR